MMSEEEALQKVGHLSSYELERLTHAWGDLSRDTRRAAEVVLRLRQQLYQLRQDSLVSGNSGRHVP